MTEVLRNGAIIHAAHKGDLVLLKIQNAYQDKEKGAVHYINYQIGTVTKVDSVGMIERARVGNRSLKYEDFDWLTAWVIGKHEADIKSILDALPAEPFDSYEDAKAFVVPFRKAREVSP